MTSDRHQPDRSPKSPCRLMASLGGVPRVAAFGATLFAVCLALWPGGLTGGDYNPELAVLTATLVALIWYAYFTFRVARPPAQVTLKSGTLVDYDALAFRPTVENLNDRPLHVRVYFNVWVDGDRVDLGPFYEGARVVTIDPGRSFQGHLPFDDHLEFSDPDEHDQAWIENDRALASMRAEWIDDLCEPGETTTLYWYVDLDSAEISSVLDPVKIEKLFALLESQSESAGPDAVHVRG